MKDIQNQKKEDVSAILVLNIKNPFSSFPTADHGCRGLSNVWSRISILQTQVGILGSDSQGYY